MILQLLSLMTLALSGSHPPFNTTGRTIEVSYYTFERANDIRFQVRNFETYTANEYIVDTNFIGYTFNYTENEPITSYNAFINGNYLAGLDYKEYFAQFDIDLLLWVQTSIYREYDAQQRKVIAETFEYNITAFKILTNSSGSINEKWNDENFVNQIKDMSINIAAMANYNYKLGGTSERVVKAQNSTRFIYDLLSNDEENIYISAPVKVYDATSYYAVEQTNNYMTISLSQFSSSADYQAGLEAGIEAGFWEGYQQGITDESAHKLNPITWIMDALKQVQSMMQELSIFESFTLWDMVVIAITIPFIAWLFKIFI